MEKILCAAIHVDDGVVYPFSQKSVALTGFVIAGFSHDEIRKCITIIHKHMFHQKEGFLTTQNRFVNRTSAAKIAYCAKQIKKETFELISTDLLEKD
jgi:hypothetical protein